jgi:hypothetical protein
VTRDFQLQVFSFISVPHAPKYSIGAISNFFECLSLVSTTSAISCSPVSTTLAINPCHGFSVIAGVVDTGNKFNAGVINTDEQLSPVTRTPMINVLPVTTTLVNYYCWCH